MAAGDERCLNRRSVLRTTGAVALTTAALGQLESASAQTTTASVTLRSQESDGDAIVIASLHTDVDARLFITTAGSESENILYGMLDLSEEESFTNRTVQLDRSIQESKRIGAVIQAGEDYDQVIANDSARIVVGESQTDERDSQTGYSTSPGIQKIDKDADAGFHSPYFLYTPKTPASATDAVNDSQKRPLFVQVYVWGDYQKRVDGARGIAKGGLARRIAEAMNCPCLTAPLSFDVFSRFGLESDGSQFTDPVLKRVDKQLLAMIKDAKSRLNDETYTVADQFQIHGFSSSAVFADTFAALHPEHVKALSSGGNGIAFLPLAEVNKDIPTYGDADQRTVPWPFGTGNFGEVADKEFNKDAWMKTNQFRYIGAQDQDPSNPDEYLHKAWKNHDLVTEIFGKSQVDDRFRTSQAIYNHLNAPATFTIYEGVGHKTPKKGRTEIARYHANQVTEEFDVVHLVPDLSATEIKAGDSMTVTVTAENATQLDVTKTLKLGIDGTPVSETKLKIPGGSSSEFTFTHTFDKPGTHTITINGHRVGDNPIKVFEPTPTPTSTPTSPATETTTTGATETTTTGATGPGFGIGTALASLAGIGYLTKYYEDD